MTAPTFRPVGPSGRIPAPLCCTCGQPAAWHLGSYASSCEQHLPRMVADWNRWLHAHPEPIDWCPEDYCAGEIE